MHDVRVELSAAVELVLQVAEDLLGGGVVQAVALAAHGLAQDAGSCGMIGGDGINDESNKTSPAPINARDLKQTSFTRSRVDNLHCDDNVYG